MTEVVVSTENVTVLGGPSRIGLELEIGPPGQRGSFIFYGFPDPNSPEAELVYPVDPQVLDFYIVVDPGSEDYLQLYQYVNQDGQLIWVPSIKLSINLYSTTRPIIFTNGVGTVNINLADLGLAGLEQTEQGEQGGFEFFQQPGSSLYLNVQMSISNFNPLAVLNPLSGQPLNLNPVTFTYLINDVFLDEVDNQLKIPITITAAEVTQSGIVPVDDKVLFVQMLITLQDPQFVRDFILDLVSGGEES
jgi:hypothetical protein